MSLMISEQTEARLTEEARRRGISVDTLLQKLIDERGGAESAPRRESRQLPVWHLGSTGPLHRRDIYSDVG